MKRIVSLILSFIIIGCLSACGNSKPNESLDSVANESDFEPTSSSSKETSSEKNDDNSADTFNPYDYAIMACQSIKDSLYNPDSIQIHQVYYINGYWHNYYIDFSAMNKVGGYTRESYQVLFNKDSSLYSFDKVHDLPEMFEEYEYEKLDTDIIDSKLK